MWVIDYHQNDSALSSWHLDCFIFSLTLHNDADLSLLLNTLLFYSFVCIFSLCEVPGNGKVLMMMMKWYGNNFTVMWNLHQNVFFFFLIWTCNTIKWFRARTEMINMRNYGILRQHNDSQDAQRFLSFLGLFLIILVLQQTIRVYVLYNHSFICFES